MAIVKARGFKGEGTGLIFTGWPSHIVLIHGSEQRLDPQLELALVGWAGPVLMLQFDDTLDPRTDASPRVEHIEQLVEFTKFVVADSRLLILCPGGYGRSTAAAIITQVVLGATPEASLQNTLADRPRATPNRLMIAMADNVLGCRGRLWAALAEWIARTMRVRVPSPVPLDRRRPKVRRSLPHPEEVP